MGDVTSVGTAKAGVFSEGAARAVAEEIIAEIEKGEQPSVCDGRGFCYIEFGGGVWGAWRYSSSPGSHPGARTTGHPWGSRPIRRSSEQAGEPAGSA